MSSDLLHAVRGALLSEGRGPARGEGMSGGAPFITLARQAGAGGRTLARAMVERLNQRDPGETPWLVYDRELIDRVARDQHISRSLVENLTEQEHTWLSELLQGLSMDRPTDRAIVARMNETIMAIAQRGRAVIVGAGGVFVTRSLPGGLHVYLVACEAVRVRRLEREFGLTRDAAQRRMRDIDRGRKSFYATFFPGRRVEPESFDVVLNTAGLHEDRVVESLLALLPSAKLARTTMSG